MTQPQAQQSQRLGNHPVFMTFINSLERIPQEKHDEAWLEMYKDLLPQKEGSQ